MGLMSRRRRVAAALAGSLVAVTVGVIAVASTGSAGAGSSGDSEAPISGDALTDASRAALAHTGGGKVTDTEVGDEESLYEVEVTLEDGSQVDVQLDEGFNVVGSKADHEDDTEGDPDN